jgi:Protein of unknown function (DUF3631)
LPVSAGSAPLSNSVGKLPVTVVNLEAVARGEYAENAHRKDFTLSEAVAIKRALEPAERAAAGDWPKQASQVAEQCCAAASDDDDTWLQILIVDIHRVFAERKTDRISSLELVEILKEIEGRPWAEFGRTSKPITQNKLAWLLKPLGIPSDTIRDGAKLFKGYHLHVFRDAFARYLDPQGVTEPKHRNSTDEMGTSGTFQSVTDSPDVTLQKCEKPNNDGHCNGVTAERGGEVVRVHAARERGAPAATMAT